MSARVLTGIGLAVVSSVVLFGSPTAAIANPVDVGSDAPLPSTDSLVEFTIGASGVACLVQPRVTYAGTSAVPDPEARATLVKAELVGSVTVSCNSTAPVVYQLMQADADLIDRTTGRSYADGAVPCRAASACVDTSGTWGAGSYPVKYLLKGQLIIETVLPLTSIKGPNCVLHSPTLADCHLDVAGQLDG
jgi:hypothetical protein